MRDKPRVERVVQYVRGNFWAGEDFADLAEAQARAETWCRDRAGTRIHGTTAQRPAEMFTELEASCLLAVPGPYDVPVFTRVKVHRDFHVEVAKALYSVPQHLLGTYLDARADSELVKLYSTGTGGGPGAGRGPVYLAWYRPLARRRMLPKVRLLVRRATLAPFRARSA
jgi:hypothetical protein